MTDLTFPTNFLWGSATSSYQIEGAYQADGKGESIWDRFSHTPGKVKNGDTGDTACDHYHRWQDDVKLMHRLGLHSYRFSIAWPRILPGGRGAVNQAGLDFYSRLVDTLLAHDIEPFVTLYHWDLPQALQDAGGWANRDTVDVFVNYADVVSRALGDRVKKWLTHNEPYVVAFVSHWEGRHAPGIQDFATAVTVAHHVLLSHGTAVPVMRQNSPDAEVGITLDLVHADPASASAADKAQARWFDGYHNRWFLDPVFGRHYPADMVAAYQQHFPDGMTFIRPGDMETIAAPIDFLGINYYTRRIFRDAGAADNLPQTTFAAPAAEHTEMGWEIHPPSLYHTLNRVHFEYRPPKIYITENGCSYSDGPDENGRIRDQRRITYLRDHFAAAHRAIQNGVPLAGYFVWSLFDNFEWGHGYGQRFGIIWIDFDTKQRLLKDSARWYKDVIAANAVSV